MCTDSSRAGRLPLREASLLMNPSDPTRQTFLLTADTVLSAFLLREIGGEVEVEVSRVAILRTDLLRWYTANRRLLPWRGDTIELSALPSLYKAAVSDPLNIEQKLDTAIDAGGEASSTVTFVKSAYGTWISEIMLQQTRVETVIPYWLKWMDRFPDVTSLANSSGDDVNAMWAGLGYYRRAQQLLRGAQKVRDNFDGMIPKTVAELRSIDGVGPYTAGAIASIAFNKVEPLVDGNVIRVLSRLFALKEIVGSPPMEKLCWSIATKLVDTESPGDFNQGLMELGATVCKPTSPSCTECPLRTVCNARILVEYATKDKKEMKNKSSKFDVEVISIDNEKKCIDSQDSILLKQKKKSVKKAALVLDYEIDLTNDDVAELEDAYSNDTGLNKDGLPISISYFPQKKKKNEAKEILVSVSVFVWNDNRGQKMCDVEDRYLFIRRPNKGGLLANQWEFPNMIISDDAINDFNLECDSDQTKQKMKTTSSSQTELKNKIKSKVKSKIEERTPGNIQKDPTTEFLWAPMPLFLEKTIGINWISYHQSCSKEVQVASSSGKSSLMTVKNEKKLSSTRKRKSISTETSIQSDIEENGTSVCVIEFNKLSDNKNSVIRVEAVCPCIALPPIVHVFSHQRHTMHVTLSIVEVHKEPSQKENSKSLDRLQQLNTDDFVWESSCGEKREIRWMTASEINSAGITSGCKKILTEVLKMQKNSKII